MASPAQIAANRANSLKSTGPRSAEGKSASRFNALKHGMDAASIVIPGENPAEYEALAAKLLARVQRQIAAFERTWYRANSELRRARAQAEAAAEESFEKYLDYFTAPPAPGALASLRQSANTTQSVPKPIRDWPPTDEKTGKPLYFVG